MQGLLLLLLLQADSPRTFNTQSYKHTQSVGNVDSRELRTKSTVSRLFFDKKTKQELFRIQYGEKLEGEWVRYWTFGLTANGDFNNDGKEDYYWDAGDDTSTQEVLILSTPTGYQQINIYGSLKAAWSRRSHAPAPDLALVSNFYNFKFTLEVSKNNLELIAEGHDRDNKSYKFRIPAQQFIPVLPPPQKSPNSSPR